MTSFRIVLSALALAGLAACETPGAGAPAVSRQSQAEAPPGAAPGTCWGRHVSPAVIETVTEQVVARPEKRDAEGTLIRPALYRTETVQKIVRERVETWFERPCDAVMTAEFTASLQRALAARDLYSGPVTGRMDRATRTAVHRYQAERGLDSAILSLETARRLGLVAVARQAP
ncbi:peptidoglycan-binding domain-containing protein [Pseudodonghicola flavimaris]|uniref:Peptidoglycan-binding domain-containing protein n=1 Tax=Pseudodonghicola flavimaris TaxID=3050036 RepID=A0ABT7EV10_9RHOB|nr:peptidoglycan-binding domain-containing protein [Pseudodonghicola flavimaris]MDK3016130.1 peptidoglycan-binding domain-containing protein [Pseudodonghicola flavimaris]